MDGNLAVQECCCVTLRSVSMVDYSIQFKPIEIYTNRMNRSISVNEDERRKLVWVLLIWRWVVCCCCCCDLLLWLGIAGTNAKGGRVGLPTRSRSTGSSWLIRKRGIRQWVMSSDIKVHQQAILYRTRSTSRQSLIEQWDRNNNTLRKEELIGPTNSILLIAVGYHHTREGFSSASPYRGVPFTSHVHRAFTRANLYVLHCTAGCYVQLYFFVVQTLRLPKNPLCATTRGKACLAKLVGLHANRNLNVSSQPTWMACLQRKRFKDYLARGIAGFETRLAPQQTHECSLCMHGNENERVMEQETHHICLCGRLWCSLIEENVAYLKHLCNP